jgi:hypothetical protein
LGPLHMLHEARTRNQVTPYISGASNPGNGAAALEIRRTLQRPFLMRGWQRLRMSGQSALTKKGGK